MVVRKEKQKATMKTRNMSMKNLMTTELQKMIECRTSSPKKNLQRMDRRR